MRRTWGARPRPHPNRHIHAQSFPPLSRAPPSPSPPFLSGVVAGRGPSPPPYPDLLEADGKAGGRGTAVTARPKDLGRLSQHPRAGLPSS